MLNPAVLLLLRSILLRSDHSHQIEHLIHADPYCLQQEEVYP
jgi:hypothetical protein